MSETTLITATYRSDSRLPIIDVGERHRGHPLALYFVYSSKGNVIIRGGSLQVGEYLDKHYPVCLYRYSFWRNNLSRGDWRSNGISLVERPLAGYRDYMKQAFRSAPSSAKYAISGDLGDIINGIGKVFFYRNLPHRWLPEWDELAEIHARRLTERKAQRRSFLT